MTVPSKGALLAELRAHLEADLEAVTLSQQQSQAGATHEEARAEGTKDMRSTETSYVARGLAMRVSDLRAAVGALANFTLARFDEDDAIAVGALVAVEDDDGKTERYLLAPAGGGVVLDGIRIVTPASPLGRALVGNRVDDDVTLDTPRGRRTLTILELS